MQRVQQAYASRAQSDYLFSFWTALGWTLLTCGIYGLYVTYQLVRRSRDHNRRRLELLEAATALAWDRATAAGRAEELRPNFERTATGLNALRVMTADFRDPAIWTVIVAAAGYFTGIGGIVVHIILYCLLDQDLVKHDAAERAIEAELAGIYGALGTSVPMPAGAPKQPHSYGGRVVATIFSLGFYTLWWEYNIMTEGNAHFEGNWVWEDDLRASLGG